MENVPEVEQGIGKGNCLIGTIDTWLIWNLTGGVKGTEPCAEHAFRLVEHSFSHWSALKRLYHYTWPTAEVQNITPRTTALAAVGGNYFGCRRGVCDRCD